LYLDALVIQQGRLVDQHQGPSKDEMMSIIKFGADIIFSAKGSTISDDEIALILSRGEEETTKFSEKLQKSSNNLLNFSLGAEGQKLQQQRSTDD